MRKLNRNELKYLALAAMLIDHVGWAFVPTASLAGQLMHFIGRLTGPTMAFFLAEGYIHTHDRRKYGIRLAVFALLSWPFFSLFETKRLFFPAMGVIYTLFIGFLAILLWDRGKMSKGWKITLTVALCLISMPGDWAVFDVLWPLFLWLYRDSPRDKWRSFTIISLCAFVFSVGVGDWEPVWNSAYALGILLVPVLLRRCYSGLPGSTAPFHKWVFYVFYPVHLFVLAILRWFL